MLLDAQPTKEFVTSEQVAALALFLCGDDAAQITGTNISIDAAGPRSKRVFIPAFLLSGGGQDFSLILSQLRLREMTACRE
ncbi:MAG: SDR family oxidoreductase [Bradyrhizobium sp.]